jgi:hypothetical protein
MAPPRPSLGRIALTWAPALFLACMPAQGRVPAAAPIRSFAVFALSRGAGVPPEALAALADIRAALREAEARGERVRITESRIGLEGELRLCVEIEDSALFLRQIEFAKARIANVPLASLAEQACDPRSSNQLEENSP